MPNYDSLFSSLEQEFKLPAGYLNRVWNIESGGGRNTYNAGSKAAGDFQFVPSTAKQYGLTDPYDINQSARAAAQLAADNKSYLESRGLHPDGGQLYLAHQQGAGGAAKLLTQSDQPAVGLLGRASVTSNGGTPDQTAGQFAQQWINKYNGIQPPAQTQVAQNDSAPPPGGWGNTPIPQAPVAQAQPVTITPSPDQAFKGAATWVAQANASAQNAKAQEINALYQAASRAPQAHRPQYQGLLG